MSETSYCESSVRYAPGWDLVHVDGGCLTIGGWSRQLRAEDSGHGPEVGERRGGDCPQRETEAAGALSQLYPTLALVTTG